MQTAETTPADRQEAQQHSEGRVARAIEYQTARLPSDTFLWAAIGSMAAAALFQLRDEKHLSLFIGQWAAPLMLMGLYNKLVKVAGSDRTQANGSMPTPGYVA